MNRLNKINFSISISITSIYKIKNEKLNQYNCWIWVDGKNLFKNVKFYANNKKELENIIKNKINYLIFEKKQKKVIK